MARELGLSHFLRMPEERRRWKERTCNVRRIALRATTSETGMQDVCEEHQQVQNLFLVPPLRGDAVRVLRRERTQAPGAEDCHDEVET